MLQKGVKYICMKQTHQVKTTFDGNYIKKN